MKRLKRPPYMDFDALALTPEQDRMAKDHFAKLCDLVATGTHGGHDAGIAICAGMGEFLLCGLATGFKAGHLSEEQLRTIINSFTKLLPKSS